jgi:hypothetical protein|tara:strand:+ start:1245 stop:1469 length:225 start_codon:yes stop_codon:yes gene_type:complete
MKLTITLDARLAGLLAARRHISEAQDIAEEHSSEYSHTIEHALTDLDEELQRALLEVVLQAQEEDANDSLAPTE